MSANPAQRPALADRRRIAAGTASIQVREAYQQGRYDGADQAFEAMKALGVPPGWLPSIIGYTDWLMGQVEDGVVRGGTPPIDGGYLRRRFGR